VKDVAQLLHEVRRVIKVGGKVIIGFIDKDSALGQLYESRKNTDKFYKETHFKYMIRPLLSLERLSFLENEGKVCYRYGESPAEVERMDYLDFIARTTSHIPDKGQVTVRYYGLYANAHRGRCARHNPTSIHSSSSRRRA